MGAAVPYGTGQGEPEHGRPGRTPDNPHHLAPWRPRLVRGGSARAGSGPAAPVLPMAGHWLAWLAGKLDSYLYVWIV